MPSSPRRDAAGPGISHLHTCRGRRASSKPPPPHDGSRMASAPEPEDGRELYALLHLSPDASGEEIRRAYRQFAQIYHPDKYQDLQLCDSFSMVRMDGVKIANERLQDNSYWAKTEEKV